MFVPCERAVIRYQTGLIYTCLVLTINFSLPCLYNPVLIDLIVFVCIYWIAYSHAISVLLLISFYFPPDVIQFYPSSRILKLFCTFWSFFRVQLFLIFLLMVLLTCFFVLFTYLLCILCVLSFNFLLFPSNAIRLHPSRILNDSLFFCTFWSFYALSSFSPFSTFYMFYAFYTLNIGSIWLTLPTGCYELHL